MTSNLRIFFNVNYSCPENFIICEVVVDQLVEQSLLTTKIHGSNPVIAIVLANFLKTKLEKNNEWFISFSHGA